MTIQQSDQAIMINPLIWYMTFSHNIFNNNFSLLKICLLTAQSHLYQITGYIFMSATWDRKLYFSSRRIITQLVEYQQLMTMVVWSYKIMIQSQKKCLGQFITCLCVLVKILWQKLKNCLPGLILMIVITILSNPVFSSDAFSTAFHDP